MRWLLAACLAGLAGCASRAPAPVAESSPPTRVEAPKSFKPATPEKLYTVKKNDTVYSIARENKLNPNDLLAWNKLDNNSRIVVGQQLRLGPPGASALAPSAQEPIEVRPIAGGGPVVARSLDGQPASAANSTAEAPVAAVPRSSTISLPAQTSAGSSEMFKREPKGGKLPYSEENLARLKGREAAPVPPPVVPVTVPAAAPDADKPAASPGAGEVEWAWPASGKLLAGFSESSGEANKGIDIAGKIGDPVLAAAAGKVIYVGTMNKYGSLVIVLHGAGYSSVYAHNSKVLVKEQQMVARGQKIAELGDSDADQPKLHFELRQQGKPIDPLRFLPAR